MVDTDDCEAVKQALVRLSENYDVYQDNASAMYSSVDYNALVNSVLCSSAKDEGEQGSSLARHQDRCEAQ